MSFLTPKTDWVPADGVTDADLKRIEGNILELFNNSMRDFLTGSALQLADNADWNTFIKTGFYRVNSTINAPPKSAPNPVSYFHLLVMKHQGPSPIPWVIQVAWDFRDGVYHRRGWDNGGVQVWDTWRRFGDDRRHIWTGSNGGQGLAANGNYRVQWNNVNNVNEGGLWHSADNMFSVDQDGWYEFSAQTYFNQSIGTGFYLEVWGDPNGTKYSIISTWAPANGYNYYSGSTVVYMIKGYAYEFVIRHSDGAYTRSTSDLRATVKRL